MLKALFENPKALVLAILVHVVLLGVLLVSIDWSSKPPPARQVETVKAVVVDEARVQAEMEKLKKAEQKKLADEKARQEKLKRDAEAAKKKRRAEERKLAELKKKQAEEAKKKAALAKQRAAEEKRLAEAKKKREAEAKRQAELKKKQEAEARRKKELAEKARRAKELQEQMLAEQQAARQAEINHYIALIRNRVSQSWLRPVGFQKGLKCTVQVNLIPSGDVVNARVTVSSGNPVFDRSVLSAVHKASPLPLPKDPVLLNEMRVINFEFEPKA